jgi:hypothetical protein
MGNATYLLSPSRRRLERSRASESVGLISRLRPLRVSLRLQPLEQARSGSEGVCHVGKCKAQRVLQRGTDERVIRLAANNPANLWTQAERLTVPVAVMPRKRKSNVPEGNSADRPQPDAGR